MILIYFMMVLTVLIYLAEVVRLSRHYIHMFQLNSYKPKVQAKWILAHISVFAQVLMFTVMAFISIVGASYLLILIAADILMLVNTPHRKKKEEKIPLKYTARVKRLIVTLAVLEIIPLILMFVVPARIYTPILLLWVLTTPWIVFLANLINRPIELSINRHYINGAKRILSESPNLTIIGITGSFGKTSVKYFLDSLLSVRYSVLKTPGSFNTPLGIVRTIRESLRATHEILICEMGAKNVGDIKEICDIVHPSHGIITSVGEMHLESFKTLDNVKKTKFELADAVQSRGMLLLNMDDENIRSVAVGYEHISYGIDDQTGYHVKDLTVAENGSAFTVHSPDGKSCSYRTALIGRHNVVNIVGAIAMANSLGISLEELKAPVRRLESVPHRLQLIDKGDYTVIDDAYNSNPVGAKAALEALSMMDGMRILVTPGMIELGEKQYELNKEFGISAASVCDYICLVGISQTKPIADGLAEVGYDSEKIFATDSFSDAMKNVYSLTSGGKRKIILLENDLPDNF